MYKIIFTVMGLAMLIFSYNAYAQVPGVPYKCEGEFSAENYAFCMHSPESNRIDCMAESCKGKLVPL